MQYTLAHYSGLIPLGAVMLWRPPVPYWLIACGFGMSWVGDTIMLETGGSWAYGYVWLPIQIGLILLALAATWAMRAAVTVGVALLTVLSVAHARPDIVLTVVGSVWILWQAHGRVTPSLYVYFGLGTVLYLLMLGADNILPAWYGYQASRLVAYGAFCWAVSWAT